MPSLKSFDFVKAFIEKEGYTLLESEYRKSTHQMKMECPVGHIFPMSWKVFRKGHRCSYCAGKRQYNIEEVRQIISSWGYTLLSEKYASNRDKLKLLGPDGNEYESTFFNMKVGKVRPHLKGKPRSEGDCRAFFEKMTGEKFIKVNPDWLINPISKRRLELDGYCEKLKLAFEFDGRYHFENKDKEELEYSFVKDRIKDKICRENGVRLIRIPHYLKNYYQFIENEIDNPGRFLYLGDPHVKVENLEESQRLLDFVEKTLKEKKTNNLIILGDLFDSHGVIRLEVLDFWDRAFYRLLKQYRIHVLIGNHDMVLGDGPAAGLNPITSVLKNKFQYTANFVDSPCSYGPLGFLPYEHDQKKFVEEANLLTEGGIGVIVCHQDINGAQYENGFYSPGGCSPDDLNAKLIIGGHIHKRQRFGKVILPGTARWSSISDANEKKGLWLVDHDFDTGDIVKEEFIPTHKVCTPLIAFEVREGEELPEIPEGRVLVTLIGNSSWIGSTSKKIKGARIIPKPTDSKERSSSGASSLVSIDKYAEKFKFDPTTSAAKVLDYIKELK